MNFNPTRDLFSKVLLFKNKTKFKISDSDLEYNNYQFMFCYQFIPFKNYKFRKYLIIFSNS